MRQEIHLYLDEKEIYFSEPPEILFTFQRVDYTNPSIIKNSFTKQIAVEGTPDNNKVFGEIWKLDRTQGTELFNPSKRVPFQLFSNGDIIETGYAKLDEVNRNGYKITYNITLYGGLGDFFYGLSYGFDYDTERKINSSATTAEDAELKLKDLTYYSSTNDDPDEFNFNITKDNVFSAWNNLKGGTHDRNMWDYINFAPAYNGFPDDFDADKVLINSKNYTSGCRLSVPAGAKVDGTTYSTQQIITSTTIPSTIQVDSNVYTQKNGYAMAELREKLTEWETKDLRSYLQRPVLRVKGLFEAIQRYAKKGEYTLNLDSDFFNESNPYFEKAWITLPMLQNLNGEYAQQEINGSLDMGLTQSNVKEDKGYGRSYYQKKQTTKISVLGIPTSSTYKGATIKLKFQVDADRVGTFSSYATKLYTSVHDVDYRNSNTPVYSSIFDVQLVAYDINDNVITKSKHHCFTSAANGMSYTDRSNTDGYGVIAHNGYFANTQGQQSSGTFFWTSDDGLGNTDFAIELEDNTLEYSKLELVVVRNIQYNQLFVDAMSGNIDYYNLLIDNYANTYGVPYRLGIWKIDDYNNNITNSTVFYKPDNDTMKSYQLITKKKLLSQDGTPADYMISYCKLFNLYFDKDPIEKIVTIRTRKNFYDTEIVNLENKIDRSKEIKISPIAFDNKWYNFNYTEGDKPELGSKYYNTWGTDYGKQKVNTGYNFDNSSNDLLEGNKYENGIEALEKSKYFTYRENGNKAIPNFLFEWSDFKLFKTDEASVESNDEFYIGQAVPTYTDDYSKDGNRYDIYPKLQLHGNENAPIDGSNILVFFNGVRHTQTKDGKEIKYYITDDNATMFSLNSNNACWLYTNDTTDLAGNEIAKMVTMPDGSGSRILRCALPVFGRNVYADNEDFIAYTWDFGKPNELFVPNKRFIQAAYPNLYSRYWDLYIADLYDVTTRIVQAYVKLDGKVEGDWLKHFYYFDNSIWCLTKIEDYNITSFDTTRCEFAKVGNIGNYRFWHDFSIPYNNVALWLEPEDQGNYNLRFVLNKKINEDLTVKYTYIDHYQGGAVETSGTTTIAAGSLASDAVLTQQDFDSEYGNAELTSIAIIDADGNETANGFNGGLDWIYTDRTKFYDFIEMCQNVNNEYGITGITQWGSAK